MSAHERVSRAKTDCTPARNPPVRRGIKRKAAVLVAKTNVFFPLLTIVLKCLEPKIMHMQWNVPYKAKVCIAATIGSLTQLLSASTSIVTVVYDNFAAQNSSIL